MRRHSSADPFARALLSGFIASAAMQLAFAASYGVVVILAGASAAGPTWTATGAAWLRALKESGLVDPGRPTLYQAIGVYLAAGLLWGIVYSRTFQRWLSGPLWERGLLFACVPWLFSIIALLPMGDGGLLGLGLGAGLLPIVGSLALHVVYGLTLAYLCGPIGDVTLGNPRSGQAQVIALQSAEAGAAVGVVAGLGLGAALGLMSLNISQLAGGPGSLGLHPLGLLAASTVTGGALGGIVGSFLGLARAEAPSHS
jgi:hypothetical protein